MRFRGLFLLAGGVAALDVSKIQNLVSFGDSLTDEGRLIYYVSNNWTMPPAGTYFTGSSSTTFSGGWNWGHVASQSLNATFYNYAVSGATCTNNITSLDLALVGGTGRIPSVAEYELPAFAADLAYVDPATGTNTLYPDGLLPAAGGSVFTLWVGANDLSFNGFLADEQAAGATLADAAACAWAVLDGVYAAGGRTLVLFNQYPEYLSPYVRAPESGGVARTWLFDKASLANLTSYEAKSRQYTAAVNALYETGLAYEAVVRERWPGASVALFDVHRLLLDVYENPEAYLAPPYNVTGPWETCVAALTDCTSPEEDPAGYMWYDELHITAAVEEIIGQEFVKLLEGTSQYSLSTY